MLWVTLRNGKILQYNRCVKYRTEGTWVLLTLNDITENIASIPTDQIERLEFEKPCKIYREKRKDKLPVMK